MQLIRLLEGESNFYLQISNLNKPSVSLEVHNTSGQHNLKTEAFEENTIDVSQFQTGLYFSKLLDLNDQHKIFKFLLN